jgi:hypothetical protein
LQHFPQGLPIEWLEPPTFAPKELDFFVAVSGPADEDDEDDEEGGAGDAWFFG